MHSDTETDDPVIRLLAAVWLHRFVAIGTALIVIALGSAWVLRKGVTHTYTTVIEVGVANDAPLETAEGVRTWLNNVAIPGQIAAILDAAEGETDQLRDLGSLTSSMPISLAAAARPLVLISMRASDEHGPEATTILNALAKETLERHKTILDRRTGAIEGRVLAREVEIRRLEAEETRVRSTTPPEGTGVAGVGSALSLLQTQLMDARDLVAVLKNELRYITESSVALQVTRDRTPDGPSRTLLLLGVLAAGCLAGTAAAVVGGAIHNSVLQRNRSSAT